MSATTPEGGPGRRLGPAALMLAALLVAGTASAEFYRYTDRQGRTHFVDEIWKIPEEYRGQVGRYQEKFDHLVEEEKAQAVQAEKDRLRALEREQQAAMQREIRRHEEEERAQRAERERQQEMRASETPVTIANNQILVPVVFNNQGQEASANLIMDTGATHTVLYRTVADRLNILTLVKGQSRVAGGQAVHSELGRVDAMRVGPITARDVPIVILSFEGGAPAYGGLLGMDFLSKVHYTIDYDASVIRWKLR